MSKPTLPNLFIIGAMKSGTTSLHQYLDNHPEIFMSRTKELNFFIEEENFSKGIDWYRAQFDESFKYNGESSQSYTKQHIYKGVSSRIKNTINEDGRFIYVVRDPIKRIISHINEAKLQGNRKNNFDLEDYTTAQLEELNYVLTSKYYYQLKPFLNFFPIKNFHFVSFEELIADPGRELNKIFNFLDLKEMELDELENLTAKNVSKERLVEAKWIRNLKNGSFLPSVAKTFIPSNSKDRIRKYLDRSGLGKAPVNQIKLSPELKKRIENVLRNDVNKFREVTGRNFTHWSI